MTLCCLPIVHLNHAGNRSSATSPACVLVHPRREGSDSCSCIAACCQTAVGLHTKGGRAVNPRGSGSHHHIYPIWTPEVSFSENCLHRNSDPHVGSLQFILTLTVETLTLLQPKTGTLHQQSHSPRIVLQNPRHMMGTAGQSP